MRHMHSENRWHNRKRKSAFATVLLLSIAMIACGTGLQPAPEAQPEADAAAATAVPQQAGTAETAVPETTEEPEPTETEDKPVKEENAKMLKMKIGDTNVAVEWEHNASVEALTALCENEPLVIGMSMYGGFEQVGPIGTRLPSNDVQTRTSAGDIVLYSSNQIVVFYGSNAWAYTRLGHITDPDAAGLEALLGHGDVTITLSMEDAK